MSHGRGRELLAHSMRGRGHQSPGCMLAVGLAFLGVAFAGTGLLAMDAKPGDFLKGLATFVGPIAGVVLVLAGTWGLTRPAAGGRRDPPPTEPWRAFPGGPDHLLDETGRRALRTLARGGWLALVAGVLGGWTLLLPVRAGAFFLGVGAAIAAAITAGVLFHGLFLLARFRRFGSARLLLPRFPWFQGEAMDLRFRARRPLPADGPLQVTLRCVEETWEATTHSDGQTSSKDLCLALHEETRTLGPKDLEAGGREFTVRFVPPGGCPPTRLTRLMPTYWEVWVRVERPGLDYSALFLLPIYARS